jgi:uncharacterized protein (DUF2147 family)
MMRWLRRTVLFGLLVGVGLLIGSGLLVGHVAPAQAADVPEGTWLVSHRIALRIFPCRDAVCGRIVWLRNPALRTQAMCGRLIVWGLTSNGPSSWTGGAFFDPENGTTYNVSANQQAPDMISARIYSGVALFGRTEVLTRIGERSLAGWCP